MVHGDVGWHAGRGSGAPGQAWERGKSCSEGTMTETFQWNPMGNQSHPAKQVRSRNRVLRVPRATAGVKRTQGVCRPRNGTSKASLCGSRRHRSSGRQHRCARWAGYSDPTGVRERGMHALGFSRNLGGPLVPAGEVRRYRHARKRSGSGRAGGSRSTLMVPAKRGNSSHEEPVEGSGVS